MAKKKKSDEDFNPTELNAARRFVAQHGRGIRYVQERSKWYVYDGHGYTERKAIGPIYAMATRTVEGLPELTNEQRSFKKQLSSHRGVNNVLSIASKSVGIVASLDEFDAHPFKLNTPHGALDLKTSNVTPPSPDDLFIRSTKCAPRTGPSPRWEKFLDDTFGADQELIDFVQLLLGQTLSAEPHEQKLFLFLGDGANGKSTLTKVLQLILGTDSTGYSTSINSALLMAGGDIAGSAVAALSGARLAIASELDKGQRWSEANVKKLTGGDLLSAKFMYNDYFTFKPTHSIILLANEAPEVTDAGHAFFRRIMPVPFAHTVPANRREENLAEVLVKEEGPSILAWLVEGARRYFEMGKNLDALAPAPVKTLLAELRAEAYGTKKKASDEDKQAERALSDAIDSWLDAEVDDSNALAQESAATLFDSFIEFCERTGRASCTHNKFGRALTKRGYESVQVPGGRRVRTGLRLHGSPAKEEG